MRFVLSAPFLFEWDEAKASGNQRKHQLEFDVALELFAVVDFIEIDVTRESDGEQRRKRTALLRGQLTTVVFTMRGDRVRLISARHANKGEEKLYGDRPSND